jgi:uncharacterized protein YgbK (DUF1537 family)
LWVHNCHPGFSDNQRGIQGYLFVVGDVLLSSGMQNHPLEAPMADANLVRVMQVNQTTCRTDRPPGGGAR